MCASVCCVPRTAFVSQPMWHVCLKFAPSIGNFPLTYRIWELTWCNPKLLFVCQRLSWFIPYESDHKWSVWHNHPVAPFSVRAFCTISLSSGPLQVYFVCISCGKNEVFLCSMHKMMWNLAGVKKKIACVFIQFCPRIMWNLTSFGIGSARITCVIASKWERQNVACVVYSSSFLSKNCRNQCAFRVVLLFFFRLAVVPYKFFLKMLFSPWHLLEHRLRTLFSSSLSKQVELVDCLRAN